MKLQSFLLVVSLSLTQVRGDRALEGGEPLVDGGEPLVKRTDDPNPLEATVQQLITQLDQLTARLTVAENRLNAMPHLQPVSFRATLPTGVGSVSMPIHGIPFQFTDIAHNDGNAYMPTTGIFTAPVSGAYLFIVQLFTSTSERPQVDLRLNGSTMLSRFALDTSNDGSAEESVMTSLVVRLRQGDRVTVENGYGTENNPDFWGGVHSFFSGVLLYAD